MATTTRKRARQPKGADADEVDEAAAESYSSQSYWDSRYEKKDFLEWYFSYDVLKPIFESTFTKESSVLEIGCGDAPLVDSLSSDGHTGKLCAIDFSANIVQEVKKKAKTNVEYDQMDARALKYDDATFDCIVDKGTIDAMLCSDNVEEAFDNVLKIMSNAVRVLAHTSPSSIVLVSHMDVDSEEFNDVLQNCILPALEEEKTVTWKILAHVVGKKSDGDDDGNKEGEEEEREELGKSATVYQIRSTPRPATRYSKAHSQPVTLEVLTYSDSDD